MNSKGVKATISIVISLLKFLSKVNGSIFECTDFFANITSPTLQVVDTSDNYYDTVIEWTAACQASPLCQYWTLDTLNKTYNLKVTNQAKAYSDSSISGESICQWCKN